MDNQNECVKPALVWKGVCNPKSLSFLACEQAPLFGRAKRAARERASVSTFHGIPQALVVQTLDSAIHRIKIYSLDNAIGFSNTYPLDRFLSSG